MSSSGRRATNRPSRKARLSKGEFNSFAQANGGLENMINWESKDKDLLVLIKYIAEEDKLENPSSCIGEPTVLWLAYRNWIGDEDCQTGRCETAV